MHAKMIYYSISAAIAQLFLYLALISGFVKIVIYAVDDVSLPGVTGQSCSKDCRVMPDNNKIR